MSQKVSKKVILTALLFLAGTLLFAQATPPPVEEPVLWGDVNGDKTVNIVDALMVAQYYVGLIQTFAAPRGADVNGDQKIDVVDALLIAQYYVGIIKSFPVENPTPSPRPSATPGPLPSMTPIILPGGTIYKGSINITVTADGTAAATVEVYGANSCTGISDWGTVARTGNAFSVSILSSSFMGPCLAVLLGQKNTYDLGILEAGDYSFSVYHGFGVLDKTTFSTTHGIAGTGKYLFEVVYENHAWSDQMRGICIDNTGKVYKFTGSLPLVGTPQSEDDLTRKYANKKSLAGTLGAGVITSMAKLIEPASQGKLSPLMSQGADMGQLEGVAYIYSPETGMYRGVLLFNKGNLVQFNTSPEAEELSLWLEELFVKYTTSGS